MIIKVKPDKNKAKSLFNMAELTLERLNQTKKEKYPTNTLNDYYDIIHNLLGAVSSIYGIKTKGEGAHKELIDEMARRLNLGENRRIFLQELMDFRNRIYYEGFVIHYNYLKSNEKKINEIISTLLSDLKKELLSE
ncbi:hypothetical protein JXB41_03460 [Candidatus Woesearchaeota archaeon]|nr:hypothetical protein [Candidatus Woesearchaeota archaeon]